MLAAQEDGEPGLSRGCCRERPELRQWWGRDRGAAVTDVGSLESAMLVDQMVEGQRTGWAGGWSAGRGGRTPGSAPRTLWCCSPGQKVQEDTSFWCEVPTGQPLGNSNDEIPTGAECSRTALSTRTSLLTVVLSPGKRSVRRHPGSAAVGPVGN